MKLKIIAIIIAAWLLVQIIPKPQMAETNPFLKTGETLIVAHGGGQFEFPDNTLEAFYNSYAVDPNVIMEMDVNLTKDGVVILSHDRTLDRKSNLQNATVSEIFYSDLVADEVDFGFENIIVPRDNGFNVTGELIRYTNYLGQTVTPLDVRYPEGVVARHPEKFLVTTLEDMLIAFPNSRFSIEIKQQGELGLEAFRNVVALLEEYDALDRSVLVSFHVEVVEAFKDYQQIRREVHGDDLYYAPQNNGVALFYFLSRAGLSLFHFERPVLLAIPTSFSVFDLTQRTFMRAAAAHGLAIHYWTINDEDLMRELIAKGADGIMTDRPTLLRQILDEKED